MISKLRGRSRGKDGFALLDVLLGMSIFALLAVIAVQSTSLFRAKADLKAVASEAQALAAGLESYMTENEDFPLPANVSGASGVANLGFSGTANAYPRTVSTSGQKDMRGLGVKLDPAHRVSRYVMSQSGNGSYQFCVVHDSGVWVAWRSSDDRIFAHSTKPATGAYNVTSNPCVP